MQTQWRRAAGLAHRRFDQTRQPLAGFPHRRANALGLRQKTGLSLRQRGAAGPLTIKAVQAQHTVAGQERGLAPEALKIIRKLYAIEKLARDGKMSAEQRHNLRQEKAKPIWDELRAWLDKNLGATPPQSLTGKAINYLAADWPRLIRYLDDGRVEISNVLCENAIRPVVIGRKNWLFSDTPAGAHA
jgi:transposase